MLVPKPLILKKRWEASQKAKSANGSSVELTLVDHVDEDMSRRPNGGHGSTSNLSAKAEEHGGGGGGGHGHGHGDHFDFGEVSPLKLKAYLWSHSVEGCCSPPCFGENKMPNALILLRFPLRSWCTR